MEQCQTFKQGTAVKVGGCVFVVGGSIFAAYPIFCIATGQPMMIGNDSGAYHRAAPWEVVGYTGFTLIFVIVGALTLLYAKNWTIKVEPQGVATTNLLGREAFRATWDELTGITRHHEEDGVHMSYTLTAGVRKAWIPASTRDIKQLLALIYEHAPHIRPLKPQAQ